MKTANEKKHEPYIAVKHAFAGKGLKLKDVADTIEVTESTLSKKLNGESDFFLAEIVTICSAFGLEQSIFFAGYDA